jgi:hypothetical protein
MFLGSLLLQVAWIAALPPFRGADEFDHAFRAASVALGQWMPSEETTEGGRGWLVTVPRQLAIDAESQCEMYTYTGTDNCHPVEDVGGGQVRILSAAAHYHPAYYWVVGTIARPFDGSASLYVMRVVGALLCSIILGAAAWLISLGARTVWPQIGLILTVTPVMAYSSIVAAPNALEMYTAAGVWSALLAVFRGPERYRGKIIASLPALAIPLVSLRPLGPLFLAGITVVVFILVGSGRFIGILNRHRLAAIWSISAIAIATGAAAAWTLGPGAVELQAHQTTKDPLAGTLAVLPLWFLQSIAAFPVRNEPAPTAVYAIGLPILLALLIAGFIRANARVRWALAASILLALAVPFILQLRVYGTSGPIWQGRYTWALSMGPLLLSGIALDSIRARARSHQGVILLGLGVLLAIEHTASIVNVRVHEGSSNPLAGDPRWITVHPAIVGLVATLGVATALWGATRSRARNTDPGIPYRSDSQESTSSDADT